MELRGYSTSKTPKMPPAPPIPKALEPRQTMLSFDTPNFALKKPGKLAKPVQKVPAKLNCQWLLGSSYKNYLARQFRTACIVAVNSDESDPEGITLHRNSYSRELKLAAIE